GHQPIAYGAALSVLSALAEPVRQLVVVAEGGADAATVALARTWRRGIAAVVTPEQAEQWTAAGFELFEERATTAGVATAYLCEDFVCRLPITSATELASALGASTATGA
ncbi:MAG: thioredoxin domain-containing protein, partial [Rhodoglobus sp.]|nr:thioredoxin domain-containing protein [Rhodoglobus sp.]